METCHLFWFGHGTKYYLRRDGVWAPYVRGIPWVWGVLEVLARRAEHGASAAYTADGRLVR